MKQKKLLALIGSVCLILVLASLPFMGACAKPAPAPAPTPTPTPAHEPYEIDIYSYKVGTSSYVGSIALAELINANSTWLKATAIEALGPTANAQMLAAKPEMRKNTLIITVSVVMFAMEQGLPPFEAAKYEGLRCITATAFIAKGFITLDPNIKTLADLRGERVATCSPKATTVARIIDGLFRGTGILDEVNIEPIGFPQGADALKDGLVDAAIGCINLSGLPDKYTPVSYFSELISTKDVYYVSFPKTAFETYLKEAGNPPYGYTLVPAQQMSPLQSEPWPIFGEAMGWYADLEMPDDVAYEICRIVYEYGEKFGEYSPALAILGKESMAKMGLPETRVHPGTLKFFSDKGMTLGSF